MGASLTYIGLKCDQRWGGELTAEGASLSYTVVHTEIFEKQWREVWTEDQRGEFAAFIAANPTAGDVIANSGGLRKVRWMVLGKGKSGGVRVIYYNQLDLGQIWLLVIYEKTKADSISAHALRLIAKAMGLMN